MLTKRIIPCLDVKNGVVVKGTNFGRLKKVGDPIDMAERYYLQGADEICFLDIAASQEGRKTMISVIRDMAKKIFIPLTVGGGIRSINDIEILLRAGADKVSICTEAAKNPSLIKEASLKFGSQCVVVSIDVKRNKDFWELYIYGGQKGTGIDAVRFAKKCESLGAGEILLNSLDTDGANKGYDLVITKLISESVSIPVIASSGGGSPEQILKAFTYGNADAALAASIFHYDRYSVSGVKDYLKKNGVDVRL